MYKFKENFLIENASPYTINNIDKTLIYVIWNSHKLEKEHSLIVFKDLSNNIIMREIIDEKGCLVAPSASDIAISSLDNITLAYINAGVNIEIWNLKNNKSFTYIPNNENDMIGSFDFHTLIFSNNNKYLIFNSKNSVEILKTKDFSYFNSIKNEKQTKSITPMFSISRDDEYLAISFVSVPYNQEELITTIQIISLDKVETVINLTSSYESLVCSHIHFVNDKYLFLLEYNTRVPHYYIRILELNKKENKLELVEIYFMDFINLVDIDSYNSIVINPKNEDILIYGYDKDKIGKIYKFDIKTKDLEFISVLNSKLKGNITKISITSDGDNLVLSNGINIELWNIKY